VPSDRRHKQRFVADPLARPRRCCRKTAILAIANLGHAQHLAAQRHRPSCAVSFDPGVLQFHFFANYAVPFPRISRSISARATSARSHAFSICSGLTASSLCSSVYLALVPVPMFGSLIAGHLESLSKGSGFRGEGQRAFKAAASGKSVSCRLAPRPVINDGRFVALAVAESCRILKCKHSADFTKWGG